MTPLPLTFDQPHPFPGKLIIVEGIDGSGKSTQLLLLQKWLEAKGFNVFFTEWNSSELVRDTTRRGKKSKALTPTTFSLLHATDFASRLYHNILPPLKAGMLVLADRYVYTALARDFVRSGNRQWARDVFGFALVPDLVCYMRIDVETLVLRVIETKGMNFWESGMDIRLGSDLYDSFKKYQSLLIEEFDKMAEEFHFEVIDARKSPDEIQDALRSKIQPLLTTSLRSQELPSDHLIQPAS